MKCKECSGNVQSSSRKAIFCSTKCRMAAHRKAIVTEPERIVTEAVEGKCHGCNEAVDKLVCICAACIAKGVRHENLSVRCLFLVNLPDGASGRWVPNWRRIGLKSKEEGLARALKRLSSDTAKIVKRSTDKQAVFFLGDKVITLS